MSEGGIALGAPIPSGSPVDVPHESYGRLFWRFLRFGLLAWGGPVAQIAMIRRELVDDERWITPAHFNRVFALYQVLPGPEAHELCVYFGMLARGRLGGFLAGLGFMLPGFFLMLLMSWLYAAQGGRSALLAAVFYGTQPAIAAAVIRAVHRIGQPVLRDRWLWAVAATTVVAAVSRVPFLVSLPVVGVAYVAARRGWRAVSIVIFAALVALAATRILQPGTAELAAVSAAAEAGPRSIPSLFQLLGSGLRTGLLTFGGAYTAIPFLQHDAVVRGGWMTNNQFLDGLALSGILPAPLIIVGTFVGYVGAGALGAIALTFGIFLPAFSFTLFAHEWLERIVARAALHTFLIGVTAGVVGLIAVTAVVLAGAAVNDAATLAIGIASLATLYLWHSKFAVLCVVLGGGTLGWLLVAAA
ncbi:MAG: chromate efflux transporter [Gemmatimonadaceae bacterium]